MLNSRMKTILQKLITAESPLTGKYLANINQVTSRTTREDVKSLNELLVENGANVDSVMGKGYQLIIDDDLCFRKYLQSIFKEEVSDAFLPKTPEEREGYLIKRLLLSEGYEKLDDLADEIYVSKSTIQNDLKLVKDRLADYDIQLESRPNYGLKITGSELKRRFCMSEYLFDRNDGSCDCSNESGLTTVAQSDLDKIQTIIMRQIEQHHITLSDIAINNLLIHIAIAYKRIKSGYHVSLYQTDMQDILDQKEYLVAEKIVREVEDTFQVKFPQAEIAYIAIHLLGTKMLSQANDSKEVVEQVLEQDIYQLVMNILAKIEAEFNLGITQDEELIIGLGLHLKPSINRYKYGMNVRNPMLRNIKQNYPLAFEAGILAGLAIEEHTETKINENEIGYLALHIGAAIERQKIKTGPKRCLIVCASGLGTAKLIYYKLKSQFGREMDVIGTTEYYKLDQYDLNDIDFIVSSIPISEKLPVPVVEVNAILGDQDLEKIGGFIAGGSKNGNGYFNKELMFLRKSFASKEEVLEFMHGELLERGLVESSFLDAVKEREAIAPTSFGNLVAVPHPITPKSNTTFLAICTLEKPILWHDKSVQFICFLCVKKNSTEDLQSMYDLLGKIIENGAVVQKLVGAGTYEEFLGVLGR
ncbi:PTS fructose transporter subunit IIA [Virgibacillus profundi]|uniref:PTS fructose transporter subunit IIA n=1 Tax=Virgibacillus profundi TaxID=2024555 RepID=A0A2A2IHM3_9BACI|nr:BglG family transcription antiterminator [Virgibacillus profundi]PAV31127.1 PTS fructose transporter subunit IIA [Virgibacillus profundi]PXY55310.1 PRD domain-containing protein [Virgibacillus profundi]